MSGWTTYHVTNSPFVVDPYSLVRNSGRQIDWDQVPPTWRSGDTEYTITCDGGAAADATSLPVVATTVAIPAGTILYFGESKEFAMLTAYAAVGSTALAVQALPAAIEDTDTATYTVAGKTGKEIPAGTVMCVPDGESKIIPYVDVYGATVDEIMLLETSAYEESEAESPTGYGCIIGGVVYETLLPDSGDTNWASIKAELVDADGGLCAGFVFESYADDRAS